jgi:pre-mRNA-processing factor 6
MEKPQKRKGRSVDAQKKAGEHPAFIVAFARLFWAELKIEKTRQWMGNAITADADWGDAWGWWLQFERQHGEAVSSLVGSRLDSSLQAQERQAAVLANCEKAQPHHGPVWQEVSKDLANVGISTREILQLVADRLI